MSPLLILILTLFSFLRTATADRSDEVPSPPSDEWECEHDIRLKANQFAVNLMPWWSFPDNKLGKLEDTWLVALKFLAPPSPHFEGPPGCTAEIKPWMCPDLGVQSRGPQRVFESFSVPSLGLERNVTVVWGSSCMSPLIRADAQIFEGYGKKYGLSDRDAYFRKKNTDGTRSWKDLDITYEGDRTLVVGWEMEKFARGQGGRCKPWGDGIFQFYALPPVSPEEEIDNKRKRDQQKAQEAVWPDGTATGGVICWFDRY